MLAVDTNLVVRLLANDDREQAARAAALFANELIFISKTVLLESEWVLRFSYDLPPHVILQALRNIIGLPNVRLEQEREITSLAQLLPLLYRPPSRWTSLALR